MNPLLVAAAAASVFAAREAQAEPAIAKPLDAPAIQLKLRSADAEAYALRSAVIARTSVERRFDKDARGEAGFLCGLEPGQAKYGPAGARGYDPTGRFVGARLSIKLR